MAYDGTPFGYRPDDSASIQRDKSYPSEVARQRPALATRIHCRDDYEARDPMNTIRGDHEPGNESPWDWLRDGMEFFAHGDR